MKPVVLHPTHIHDHFVSRRHFKPKRVDVSENDFAGLGLAANESLALVIGLLISRQTSVGESVFTFRVVTPFANNDGMAPGLSDRPIHGCGGAPIVFSQQLSRWTVELEVRTKPVVLHPTHIHDHFVSRRCFKRVLVSFSDPKFICHGLARDESGFIGCKAASCDRVNNAESE